MNLKNPDLDLIWRIHSKCGFSGFMIRFWILEIKRKIRFRIQESGFGFPQKNASKVWHLIIGTMILNRIIINGTYY